MTEHDRSSPTPEDLLNLKDGILAQWRQLPPEHQATMTLVLLQQTLEGEYSPWLRSSVTVMTKRDSDSPFRFLPSIRINAAHLEQANLTEDEIAQLDDEDLMQISHGIVQHYTKDVFWEELAFNARRTLAEKTTDNSV